MVYLSLCLQLSTHKKNPLSSRSPAKSDAFFYFPLVWKVKSFHWSD